MKILVSMKEKFYNAWNWLDENHPWSTGNLCIEIVKVNPKTKKIDDRAKNTLVNYWLEGGPFDKEKHITIRTHDYRLDCGADTFEQAVIKYQKLVKMFYGEKTDFFGKKTK